MKGGTRRLKYSMFHPSPYVPFLDERLSQGLSKIFKAVLLTEGVYVHQNSGFTFKDS